MKKSLLFILVLSCFTFYGQWLEQVSGTTQNLNDVYCVTENLIFSVGNNGTILKTIDGGTTWTQKISGTNQKLLRIQFTNQNVGYAVGLNGVLLKTVNGGEIWNIISINSTSDLLGLSVVSEDVLFISGKYGLIKKSIDGGISFFNEIAPENNTISNIQFFGELIGYAQVGDFNIDDLFSQSNNLYKTINGGVSWTLLSGEVDTFYFVTEAVGFIHKLGYPSFFKTNNGGINLINITHSNNSEKDIFSLDGNVVWDLGVNQALCSCTDFCINKKEIQDFTLIQDAHACHNVFFGGRVFNAIHFANELAGFMVGFGGIIYKNGTGICAPLATENFSKSKIIQIFPIPATDNITITLNEIPNNDFLIEITDSLGKQIFSKSYNLENKITIDSQNFSKGIYFLTVKSGETIQTEKIIKI